MLGVSLLAALLHKSLEMPTKSAVAIAYWPQPTEIDSPPKQLQEQ